MPISRSDTKNISEFVDTLLPGTRVIWVANGAAGTVQADKTILWDDGQHMKREELKKQSALLLHSESEKKQLRDALEARLKCLKSHCKLVHWDDDGYHSEIAERLCPLAVLTVPPSKSRSVPSRVKLAATTETPAATVPRRATRRKAIPPLRAASPAQ